MNPLNTIKGTIIAGVVVSIIIAALIGGFSVNGLALDRWIHIGAGITWIGLLYYFNFVQVPALGAAAADQGGPGGAGITKYVAPLALLWFRWAAAVTWISGAVYLWMRSPSGADLHGAFTLGLMSNPVNQYQLVVKFHALL